MFRWPWIGRGRLDDARALIAEQREKISSLECEQKRLLNVIMVRHNIRPLFPEQGAEVAPAFAPPVPQPVLDPFQREVATPVTEAINRGARSARAVCSDVERTLQQRHLRQGQHPRPIIPPAQAAVAAELEKIVADPVNSNGGGNGAH